MAKKKEIAKNKELANVIKDIKKAYYYNSSINLWNTYFDLGGVMNDEMKLYFDIFANNIDREINYIKVLPKEDEQNIFQLMILANVCDYQIISYLKSMQKTCIDYINNGNVLKFCTSVSRVDNITINADFLDKINFKSLNNEMIDSLISIIKYKKIIPLMKYIVNKVNPDASHKIMEEITMYDLFSFCNFLDKNRNNSELFDNKFILKIFQNDCNYDHIKTLFDKKIYKPSRELLKMYVLNLPKYNTSNHSIDAFQYFGYSLSYDDVLFLIENRVFFNWEYLDLPKEQIEFCLQLWFKTNDKVNIDEKIILCKKYPYLINIVSNSFSMITPYRDNDLEEVIENYSGIFTREFILNTISYCIGKYISYTIVDKIPCAATYMDKNNLWLDNDKRTDILKGWCSILDNLPKKSAYDKRLKKLQSKTIKKINEYDISNYKDECEKIKSDISDDYDENQNICSKLSDDLKILLGCKNKKVISFADLKQLIINYIINNKSVISYFKNVSLSNIHKFTYDLINTPFYLNENDNDVISTDDSLFDNDSQCDIDKIKRDAKKIIKKKQPK